MFVIQRLPDGAFATPPGSVRSYTSRLQDARVYETWAEAERDRCENERIRTMEEVMRCRK